MKKKADEYLYNEALKYLGKYPATKKKISEILKKRLKNKKTYQKVIFSEDISKQELIDNIVQKLDDLKIIDEKQFIETVFHYYEQSLFSLKKIKNKLYQKGFEQSLIEEYISKKVSENPDLELDILKRFILRKKLSKLETSELKKKLYQQNFSENSIYKVILDFISIYRCLTLGIFIFFSFFNNYLLASVHTSTEINMMGSSQFT